MIITTSWDDGYKSDLRLTKLLNQYGLRGTFYIPKICELRSLTDQEVVDISKTQEIGAHDFNHDHLTQLNPDQIRKQVSGAKNYLDNLLTKPVKMYSYPRGEYNQQVKEIVKENGFLGARTVKEFSFQQPDDFFEMGTTIHIYPFPFRKRDAHHYHLTRFLFQPIQRKFFRILKTGLPWNSFINWPNLAKNMFDCAKKKDGIFHLWGHSWELDKYDMWDDLEELFKYITQHQNIVYLTNSQILKRI